MSYMLPLAMLGDIVTPEHFGAKGDDPGDGTGTDDRAAFQAAIDSSRRVFLMPNKTYRIHGELLIPGFQQIIGFGYRSATGFWVETGQTGATRLIFTGSGQACFKNKDATQLLNQCQMSGFIMRAQGAYNYMMYFRELLGFVLDRVGMETDSLTTGAILSQKLAFDHPSFLNVLTDVAVRLPDASPFYTLNVDWSDSIAERCSFSGGVGILEQGYGTRFQNNQIERSSYAGLTILKTGGYSSKNTICVGNSFDANAGHGIMFQADGDTSGTTKFDTTITGNNFRTQDPNTNTPGGATIAFNNTSASTYSVGPITGNVELVSGVPQLAMIGSWSVPANVGNWNH